MVLAVQGFFFFAAAATKLRTLLPFKGAEEAIGEGPFFLLPGTHSGICVLAALSPLYTHALLNSFYRRLCPSILPPWSQGPSWSVWPAWHHSALQKQ